MKNINVIRIMLISALLLLIPLTAKIFFDEMNWDETDFIAAWILFTVTGIIYKLITKNKSSLMYKFASFSAVATGLLLMWVNLAVGLIGNENNPANLMYFAVIIIGLIGAAIGRFKSHGIIRALYVTALAQALVPIIAMLIWKPPFNAGVIQVIGINAFFVALWLGSAFLFRNAAKV